MGGIDMGEKPDNVVVRESMRERDIKVGRVEIDPMYYAGDNRGEYI